MTGNSANAQQWGLEESTAPPTQWGPRKWQKKMRRSSTYCYGGNTRRYYQKVEERWWKCFYYATTYLRTGGWANKNKNDTSKPSIKNTKQLSIREGGNTWRGQGKKVNFLNILHLHVWFGALLFYIIIKTKLSLKNNNPLKTLKQNQINPPSYVLCLFLSRNHFR